MEGRKGSGRRHRGALSRLALQKQMMTLRAMGTDIYAISLFVWLQVRVDLDTGWCHDRIEILADEMGAGRSSVEAAIRWLKARGVVDVVKNEKPVTGGPRGSVWSWRRRVLPMDEWHQPGEEPSRREASSPRRRYVREGEEPSPHGRRTLAPSVHISSPKGEKEDRAPRVALSSHSPSGDAALAEVNSLARRLAGRSDFTQMWRGRFGLRKPHDMNLAELQEARDFLAAQDGAA